jgi:hypothetical protein
MLAGFAAQREGGRQAGAGEPDVAGGELVLLDRRSCASARRDVPKRSARSKSAKAHFAAHDTLTLAELRDALGTSRKYALARAGVLTTATA